MAHIIPATFQKHVKEESCLVLINGASILIYCAQSTCLGHTCEHNKSLPSWGVGGGLRKENNIGRLTGFAPAAFSPWNPHPRFQLR